MSRAEIIALVALATAAYPAYQGKDPEPIVSAWSLMLADLPFPLARAAVVKVCRSSRFFPSIAEIAAAARELDPETEKPPTAAEAWEEVCGLIQAVGPYRAPRYSSEIVRRAVRAIGWRQLCVSECPEADRAHFFRLYESMRERRQTDGENAKALELTAAAWQVKGGKKQRAIRYEEEKS